MYKTFSLEQRLFAKASKPLWCLLAGMLAVVLLVPHSLCSMGTKQYIFLKKSFWRREVGRRGRGWTSRKCTRRLPLLLLLLMPVAHSFLSFVPFEMKFCWNFSHAYFCCSKVSFPRVFNISLNRPPPLSLSLFSFKLKFFFEKVKLGLTFLEFMRRGDPYFIIFPLSGMKWSKWNNFSLEIKNFLSNGPTTASFCFFCRSFQTHKLYRNNCRLQRDSNSDHWNTLTTWLPPQPTKLSFAMNANYLNPFFLKQRKPWSSNYGRRLMIQRLWVRIPAPYTGWRFFHIPICCKICNVCLKRRK